jgi:hypothetical protein
VDVLAFCAVSDPATGADTTVDSTTYMQQSFISKTTYIILDLIHSKLS